jgi:hypothetical protein
MASWYMPRHFNSASKSVGEDEELISEDIRKNAAARSRHKIVGKGSRAVAL